MDPVPDHNRHKLTEAKVCLEAQTDRKRNINEESGRRLSANEEDLNLTDNSAFGLPLKDCASPFDDFRDVRARVRVECRINTILAEANTTVRRAKEDFWNMCKSISRMTPLSRTGSIRQYWKSDQWSSLPAGRCGPGGLGLRQYTV
ncbi:unnamed protein product [Dibothriocephalus latus]|uniref:Uncharacterized protein n=1 Tax=Dibothriocephalus latus TaxID=60516 RepID=A0A3P6PQM5_DIBLA|nr:unnamed protein product [Dibothriocephalus latus]